MIELDVNHPKYKELSALAKEIAGLSRTAKESRSKLAEAQKRLAQTACPFVRGDMVRYVKGEEERVAMVSEIEYSLNSPHYKITVRQKNQGQISRVARLICPIENEVRSA